MSSVTGGQSCVATTPLVYTQPPSGPPPPNTTLSTDFSDFAVPGNGFLNLVMFG